jgi:hypothetical protein
MPVVACAMPTLTELSEVAICNLALQDVGRGLSITALDENSQAARACRLRYPFARDACLRAYDWNFAAARASCLLLLPRQQHHAWARLRVHSRLVWQTRRRQMLSYLNQECASTLAQGIGEYHAAHPFLKRGDALSPAAREFFRCHDVVHVVYGCDTSLNHEAIVKLSSFFGTTEGLRVMRGYRLYESLDIYRQLQAADILRTIAAAPVLVPRTIWRCARQRKRWPWSQFDQFLGLSLHDIRVDFGIRVATAF